MTPVQAYYFGRQAAGTGARCPHKPGTDLAIQWTKGRNEARRANRMDLRPSFRKSRKTSQANRIARDLANWEI